MAKKQTLTKRTFDFFSDAIAPNPPSQLSQGTVWLKLRNFFFSFLTSTILTVGCLLHPPGATLGFTDATDAAGTAGDGADGIDGADGADSVDGASGTDNTNPLPDLPEPTGDPVSTENACLHW